MSLATAGTRTGGAGKERGECSKKKVWAWLTSGVSQCKIWKLRICRAQFASAGVLNQYTEGEGEGREEEEKFSPHGNSFARRGMFAGTEKMLARQKTKERGRSGTKGKESRLESNNVGRKHCPSGDLRDEDIFQYFGTKKKKLPVAGRSQGGCLQKIRLRETKTKKILWVKEAGQLVKREQGKRKKRIARGWIHPFSCRKVGKSPKQNVQ